MKLKVIIAALVGIIIMMTSQLVFAQTLSENNIIINKATSLKIDEKINSSFKEKQKDQLDLYLDRLIIFECGRDYKSCDHEDVNGKISYGCLQFQQNTFEAKSVQYGLRGDIAQCDDQRQIARAMFQENPIRASYAWYTSIYTRGLGLPGTAVSVPSQE